MTRILSVLLAIGLFLAPMQALAQSVRVKDMGRFLGWRENALVGYGIVTGLSGSGDSPGSKVTRQALTNVLSRFGANVSTDDVHSRNVAAVMVTAVLPPSAHLGDKVDIAVSSIGDARSLVGGTLLMTPLMGPDQRTYALAQGPLVVGGYRFDAQQNRQQKNYPTSGVLPGGATIEMPAAASLLNAGGELTFILKEPDTMTAERIKDGINAAMGMRLARVADSATVVIDARTAGRDVYGFVARVENVAVTPDQRAVVVVNERSGTVVAGGSVQISSVVVSQGDIKVSISQDNDATQPFIAEYGAWNGLVVASKKIEVTPGRDAVVRFPNTTVGDLVQALHQANVDTRGIIAILQSIKAAGALHADLVVQ
ncbi:MULTISPECIES: flagellar basal body P-ring protein FlgI [Asticcacaulis]|uniref:flagellar basal body P-ring protein FlgI n=1 Tax=Asticcacaulis TaxID=76890 RepID=UPI001AEA5DE3|nr:MULTISPECIES: flagellar basal body P-ring protein FlgI [Asticcacaulis]MBP2161181.1 flagellar P-ring protein precursor FlgI [Asticcacaulis solisilvae]MDR6802226.1 flagellar P-ring protein precursor FlgI [Asticcacaulis sp. BE141]